MKSAYLNAVLGMVLLAIPFALLGRYFKHLSSEIITPVVYGAGLMILAPLGLMLARVDGVQLVKPAFWWQYAAIAGCGIALGLGDYFTVKAFNTGGETIMVATIIAIMPVFATIIVAVLGGGLPSWRMWAGCVLAIAAVILVRGEKRPTEQSAASATPVAVAENEQPPTE